MIVGFLRLEPFLLKTCLFWSWQKHFVLYEFLKCSTKETTWAFINLKSLGVYVVAFLYCSIPYSRIPYHFAWYVRLISIRYKNELRLQIRMKGKTILNDVFRLQYFC